MCNMKSNLFSLNLFCSPKKRKTIVSDLTQSSFGPSLQWIPWQEIFSSNLWRNWKEITNSSSPLLCTWMDFEIYRNSFKGHYFETVKCLLNYSKWHWTLKSRSTLKSDMSHEGNKIQFNFCIPQKDLGDAGIRRTEEKSRSRHQVTETNWHATRKMVWIYHVILIHKKLDFNPLIPPIELPDVNWKLTEHWMLSFKVFRK